MSTALYVGMRTFIILGTLWLTGILAMLICGSLGGQGWSHADFESMSTFMSLPMKKYATYFVIWAGLEVLTLDSFY